MLWILFVALALIIGLYPGVYFIIDRKFGLLGSKSDSLLQGVPWNIGFYTHIILGGLALLTGWPQFLSGLRDRRPVMHRRMGLVYLVAVLGNSLAGIGIGFFVTGGLIAAAGFISLGVIWFTTTLLAFLAIRKGEVLRHQALMTYSYAATFAAVTLRVWLPILMKIFGGFETAYLIVAWLCWVPNLLVARWIVGRAEREV
jgi:Predicted membrane protein (DUF2306)